MLTESFFHVGVIVPRLEAGLDHLSNILGLSWMPVTETQVPVTDWDTGVDHHVALRFAYSVEDPHLEVIEEVPGSVWVCNPGSNLHHIGFWSDDLPTESSRLHASTCPIEIAGYASSSERPALYTYHADSLGIRVELIDSGLRAIMEAGFAEARAGAANRGQA